MAIALGADGGGIWLYVAQDERLVCELNRIPEVVAVGDLDAENVNRVVLRSITDRMPILVSRAEVPVETDGGQDISVVCVSFPLDEGVAGALLLYRDASGGQYFTRESVYLCQSLTPFLALHAARTASREVATRTQRLGGILELAVELATTQDPERIAYVAANRVPSVVPCERAFLAAVQGERVRMLAVSGHDEVHHGSAQVEALRVLAAWGARQGRDWYLTEESVNSSEDDQIKERFTDYRDATGMRSCLLVLLRGAGHREEEREVLAVLVLESREPRVYTPADMTVLGVLAKLLASSLERARQYARLPAIGLLEGVSKLRRRSSSRARFLRRGVVVGAVVLGLVFARMPFRAGGVCYVGPRRRATHVVRVSARVKRVPVQEGGEVAEGDLLMELDDQELLVRLEGRRHALAATMRQLRAYGAVDRELPRYRVEQANAKSIQAEIALLQQQLSFTRITSRIDGIVLTPRMEDLEGRFVVEGTPVCEVAPLRELELEVAVPEGLIGHVKEGQEVSYVLNPFPGSERGTTVTGIRLRSEPRGQKNTFVVTCPLDNADGELRPGMTGYARIDCGRRRVGFVLFRKAIVWFQLKVLF